MPRLRAPLLALPLLAALLPLLPPPAAAQAARCAPRAQLLDHLGTRQQATRRAMGLTAQQTVMELYASDATGRWTIVVTLPNGLACLVAAGEGFEMAPDAPGAPA